MSKIDDTRGRAFEEAIDQVLKNAQPRPIPRSSRKDEIYAELHTEWRAGIAGTRRRRNAFAALAATIVGGLFMATQIDFKTEVMPAMPEATLVRFDGSGTHVNGQLLENLAPVNDHLRFQQGDTIETGANSALAIAWKVQGSLRVSESTTLTVLSNERVGLEKGEIYYDSKSLLAASPRPIVVETPLGVLRHSGTQFLTRVSDAGVKVSVREGTVSFESAANNFDIHAGESAFINKLMLTSISKITSTDPEWQWATRIAPHVDIDGLATAQIIQWLSRETGLPVTYASRSAETFATNDRIWGIGSVEPLQLLTIIPVATDLRFDVEQGKIRVWLASE